jgi:hypothetical protein
MKPVYHKLIAGICLAALAGLLIIEFIVLGR